MTSRLSSALLVALLSGCAASAPVAPPSPATGSAAWARSAAGAVDAALAACREVDCGFEAHPGAAVDTVQVSGDRITVLLNDVAAQVPFRESDADALEEQVVRAVAWDRPVEVRVLGQPVHELIPNAYRTRTPVDTARRPPDPPVPRPIVRTDGRAAPTAGLYGRHIAVWPSHGWYYEPTMDRWEWQRARLFTTVEDLLPAAFVLPYLVPMLERAGAHVWLPRERDTQPLMAVVDNDGASGGRYTETGAWIDGGTGFAEGHPPYGPDDRPFAAGTVRRSVPGGAASARWEADLPGTGDYAVYASWGTDAQASREAQYTVAHAGGTTTLIVDQTMAAGTWVFLGTFRFVEGGPAGVTLAAPSAGVVTADAVRFGGGTGLIARGGTTSGRPRWMEGARYHLQYAGMPAELVYNVTEAVNDYVDDYRGRAEWVNYLRGAPYGPNKDPDHPGLGIPVDLSLAFHTDAGITADSSTIGTLIIHSTDGNTGDKQFPDGMSRFANRDLADRLQTRVVSDIRALHDPGWNRRGIWDRDYSEAFRPNVPSVLLELLSHQNFADMRFALDPAFRFDVARAIYKAFLGFLHDQYGGPAPVVQPLAPDHLEARLQDDGRVRLAWRSRVDPLEPSAAAESYRVYVRRGTAGFDGGRDADGPTSLSEPLEPGVVYGFRVTAVNEGGESAPSETVAAAWQPEAPRVLVVSGFDRVSAPASVDRAGWRGFVADLDAGVADGLDLAFIGRQHEFDALVPWTDDDAPGHGASYGTWETQVQPGNTFDFAAVHAEAIVAAGYAVDTISDEAVARDGIPTGRYVAADYLLGEERGGGPGLPDMPNFAGFPDALVGAMTAFARDGGRWIVSGAHAGEELAVRDSAEVFGRTWLGVRLRAGRSVQRGGLHAADESLAEAGDLAFATEPNPWVYAVEGADAIEPGAEGARTLLRYTESNMSAAVGLPGRSVTLGFPFETVLTADARARLMQALLAYVTSDL